MIGDTHLPADEHMVSNGRGARETALCCHQGVLSNLHIMADVNVGVELASFAEACGFEGARIDGSQRSDLDIVFDFDAPELWHTDSLPIWA